ncbi:MAG: RDD family protein [Betaproteobacteria bacterium]
MTADFVAPSIKRRICVTLYEMMILLGVFAIGYLIPSLILGLYFDYQVPSWVAFVQTYALFGFYFIWYWTHSGQTLAMQTWHVKILDLNNQLISKTHALKRYCISTLWLIPTVTIYGVIKLIFNAPLGHWPTIELMFCMALFFWPITCLLDRKNSFGMQSLVDRLAKTRLVQLPKV